MTGTTALAGDETMLFAEHHERLLRSVRFAVDTDGAVIEDACCFAWLQLVRTQPERTERIFGWLRTVAIREAYRLDASRRTYPLEELPAALEPARREVDLAIDAHAALCEIGDLPPRQRHVIGRQVAGLSYDEISKETGDTRRTASVSCYAPSAGWVPRSRWREALA